jgi:hypothetical protein
MARAGLIRLRIEVGREAMISPLDFTAGSIAAFMKSAVGKVHVPEAAAECCRRNCQDNGQHHAGDFTCLHKEHFCNYSGHNFVKKIINCPDSVSAHVIDGVSPVSDIRVQVLCQPCFNVRKSLSK